MQEKMIRTKMSERGRSFYNKSGDRDRNKQGDKVALVNKYS